MRSARVLPVAIVLAAVVAPQALAQGGYETDPTREMFVAEADPLCRDAFQRSEDALRGIGKDARKGRYKAGGRKYVRLGQIELDLVDDLAALARPPSDADTIDLWLSAWNRSARLTVVAGNALKQARFGKFENKLEASIRAGKKGRRLAKPLGLEFCV